VCPTGCDCSFQTCGHVPPATAAVAAPAVTSHSTSSIGAVAGGVIGGIVALALVIALVVYVRVRSTHTTAAEKPIEQIYALY
jgi:hypothetical protein